MGNAPERKPQPARPGAPRLHTHTSVRVAALHAVFGDIYIRSAELFMKIHAKMQKDCFVSGSLPLLWNSRLNHCSSRSLTERKDDISSCRGRNLKRKRNASDQGRCVESASVSGGERDEDVNDLQSPAEEENEKATLLA